MNDGNLIPLNERTKDEQREIAKMGGIASGASRRAQKSLRAAVKIALEENPNATMRITLALLDKCFDGDVKAIDKLQDLLGETVQHDRLKFDQKQAKEAKTGKQSAELPKLMSALKEGADDDIRDPFTEAEDGI